MTTGITDALTVQPADDGPNPAPDLKLPEPDVKAESPAPPPPPPPVAPPKKTSRWKELLVTVLLAAFVGAAVAGGTIVGVEAWLGRFSSSRLWEKGESGHGGGNLEAYWDGDMLTQKGRVTVPASGKVEVHYPTGYTRPPALTWKSDSQNYWTVSKQTTTGFEVTSNLSQAYDFHWEAKGVGDKSDKGGRRDEKGK